MATSWIEKSLFPCDIFFIYCLSLTRNQQEIPISPFYFYYSCLITGTEVRINQKNFWIPIIIIKSWSGDIDIADLVIISQRPDFGWSYAEIEGLRKVAAHRIEKLNPIKRKTSY